MILAARDAISKRPRIWLSLAVGLAAGFATPVHLPGVARALLGWNAGVWLYLALILAMMVRASAERVHSGATREDESAGAVLVIVSVVAVASIVAIIVELSTAKSAVGVPRAAHFILAGSTVVGGWLLVPTVFAIHYARLYYGSDAEQRSLRFPDKALKPLYWDFLYFSFTIAVASQTSDVAIASPTMRRVVLAQSLLAFVFNTTILAFSINIAASVVGS